MFKVDPGLAKAVGEALAIGLLIGVERYKSRSADDREPAGIRTFAVIALIGAFCSVMQVTAFTIASLAGLLIFLGIAYYRQTETTLGMTTEAAAILTFWFGYLVRSHETLVISAAIVLVILLASKTVIHEFVKGKVTELEFYDTLKFLAVVFVIFPLLPNRHIGPYEFLNPAQIWMLVILVSTISYSGYVMIRVLGAKRGLRLHALVAGLVSTTAVTMSLAEQARQKPEASRLFGVTGVMANAVQFPRLLVLVAFVDPDLARYLAAPLLGMFAAGMAGTWILGRVRKVWKDVPPVDLLVRNPYSFWPALKFALLFVAVFFVAKFATVSFGNQGVFVASGVAGLVDASAISLSLADMTKSDSVSMLTASWAILIATAVNALVKWILAWVNGNRSLAFWLGGGFLTMLGTGATLLAVLHGW